MSRRRPAASPTAARIDLASSLDELREDWVRLAYESRNLFSTWEWASTWWRHYGAAHDSLVASSREGQDVVALLPLYLWSRRPVRIARFIGHGPADQLGPISAPGADAAAAETLWQTIEHAALDLVLMELLAGRESWKELLRQEPLLRESSPTISLGAGWEAYLAGRSANLRQQIRRRGRQLDRRHAVRFRMATEPHRLQEDLTLLYALHRARWGDRSAFSRFEDFHRDFAAVALERGWLRLWFLELDERPAAALYGFRFAGVESYYQAGRDPAFHNESVGFVLLAHSIRQAAEDGVVEYRLLRGAEPFKLRFADADPGVETFAPARGVAGRAARTAAAVGLHSATVRSALRRLG